MSEEAKNLVDFLRLTATFTLAGLTGAMLVRFATIPFEERYNNLQKLKDEYSQGNLNAKPNYLNVHKFNKPQ